MRAKHPDLLHEVRGLGLLIGLEYCSEEAGYAVATGLFGEGVLTGGTLFSAKTFRIEPPATLTQHQMDEVVARLDRVMGGVQAQIDESAGVVRLTRTPVAPSGTLGAAVHLMRLAGDPRAGVRADEQDHRGHVVGGHHRASETAATRSAATSSSVTPRFSASAAITRLMRSPSTSPGQMAFTRMA